LISKRPKFFYGWWIVFTAALGLCLGGPPIAVFSFGVFFKSLVHEFHASRAAISFAFTIHNIVGAMCAPLMGWLIDRFGASALGMAILWMGSTGNIALAAAFLVGLGMGAESDIIAYLISRYFGLRAFGTAFGHCFGAFMLAGAIGTLLMGAGYDWTHSYSVPLAWFFGAMVAALGLLARLGPYRNAAEPGESRPSQLVQTATST